MPAIQHRVIIADAASDLAGDMTAFLRARYSVELTATPREALRALDSPWDILILAADFGLDQDNGQGAGRGGVRDILLRAARQGGSLIMLGVSPEIPAAGDLERIICLRRYPGPLDLSKALEELLALSHPRSVGDEHLERPAC